MDTPHSASTVGGGHGVDHGRGDGRQRGNGDRGHMIDPGWFPLLGFLLFGSGLRTALSLMSLTVTIPTNFGQGTGLDMTRCVGGAVAGAAEAVLYVPQDLGCILQFLLAAGVLPLGAARLASACGGVGGLGLGLGTGA